MEICKHGAAQWARDHGQPVLWSPADDRVASSCGLIDDERLREKKVSWLSRHDKSCGGLFGMLPLVRGMPVFLTNHTDRSEKALLRGCTGTLLDWELNEHEPHVPHDKDHFLSYLPKCIYVQFYEEDGDGKRVPANWSVGGMPPGVYCIAPNTEHWYLDAKASFSHMRIKRQQLGVAPDFARTAYSMQGFTLPAGKIDLNLSKQADPVTLYVAMSRFKKADDVLILQPFDISAFQEGVPDQPALLLEYLSCKNEDEKARLITEYEERVLEESAMKKQKMHDERSAEMKQKRASGTLDGSTPDAKKRKKGGESAGRQAANTKRAEDAAVNPRTRTCNECNEDKTRKYYSEREWNKKQRVGRACRWIHNTTKCKDCGDRKCKEDYLQWDWRHHRDDGLAVCRACLLL